MPQYWLMKSEPDCFSIEDLRNRPNQTSPWDGVRNYQARNFMKDQMKVGDKVFFYHSNAKPPGIAGIAEIASKPYPDHTQFDPKSQYFDEKASPEKPRWFLVDVKFKKVLPFISLDAIKSNPRLKDMVLVQTGSRLSIQPVTKDEWDEVLGMISAVSINS